MEITPVKCNLMGLSDTVLILTLSPFKLVHFITFLFLLLDAEAAPIFLGLVIKSVDHFAMMVWEERGAFRTDMKDSIHLVFIEYNN